MDPLTLALIIGGGSAAAAKLGGASTKDSLKTGILSGGMSFVNPAGAAANPYAQAFAQESGKQGIKSLLIESAKQGVLQRGAKKLGVDPMIAQMGYNMFNTPGQIPGVTSAADQVSMANNLTVDEAFPGQSTSDIINQANNSNMLPTTNVPYGVGETATGIGQIPTTANVQNFINPTPTNVASPTGGFDYDSMIGNQAVDVNYVTPGGLGGGETGGYLEQVQDVFKTDGAYDIDKIAKGATLFGVPALLYASGAFKDKPQTMYQPTYNINYPELRQARGPLQRIDEQGNQVDVAMQRSPEELYGSRDTSPYQFTEKTFYPKEYNQGGLASIQKFNEGGLSKVPNKITHDENDVNNYMRLNGYIEDNNGHKNEDTLLAQLADGEFVTRTDGVLGAGIIAGASPKSEKEMREKGAKFFYEQQKRFKRVFDLLNENRARKLH